MSENAGPDQPHDDHPHDDHPHDDQPHDDQPHDDHPHDDHPHDDHPHDDHPHDDHPLPANRPNPASDPGAATAPASGRRWLLLALAFVVGLVLGGLGWALIQSPGTTSAAGAAPTVTVTSPAPAETGTASPTIVLPAACKEISTEAQTIRDLLGQAAAAAQSLDATKMSTVLREMDTQQRKITDSIKACTDAMPPGVS